MTQLMTASVLHSLVLFSVFVYLFSFQLSLSDHIHQVGTFKHPTIHWSNLSTFFTEPESFTELVGGPAALVTHCLVHLLPTYRQKLKSAKSMVKTVRRWTTRQS